MANWYYYDANGQKQGPLRGRDLSALAKNGTVTPETVVENEQGQRGKAGQIKELVFAPAVINSVSQENADVYGVKSAPPKLMPVLPQPAIKMGKTNAAFPIIAKLGGLIQHTRSGIPQELFISVYNTEMALFTLLEIYDNKIVLKRGTGEDQYHTQKMLTFSKISAIETGTGQIGGVWSPAGKKSNGKTAFVCRAENAGYIQFSISGGSEQNSTGLAGALLDENSVVFWIGSDVNTSQMEIATAAREFIEAKIEGVDSTEAYNALVAASRQQPGFRIVERCQDKINWVGCLIALAGFFAFIIIMVLLLLTVV